MRPWLHRDLRGVGARIQGSRRRGEPLLTNWRKLSFWTIVVATSPCLVVAVLLALAEVLVGSTKGLAQVVARPFLWAVERGDDR